MNAIINDAKKIFRKKGTCSQTLCYLLNRDFGYIRENEERATDLLAGGIIRKGHQCGMLWGAVLAVGAESFRRNRNRDQAIGLAIKATQQVVESFIKTAKSINCKEITKSDWTKISGVFKYFLTGKMFTCFNLVEKWAPEAIRSAKEGLSQNQIDLPQAPISCASEVAKKMGANDEEMVMVAGFAGGIGLSGHGCGALGAAIWMSTLAWSKEHPGKSIPIFNNTNIMNLLKDFCNATDSNFLCTKITGQCFKSIDDHSQFIKNGGCAKLINALAQTGMSTKNEVAGKTE